MTRQILVLKGINVGRAKRIAMADLRALLTDLGYTDVKTLLQSGNAVFDAGSAKPVQIEQDVREAINERHKFDAACLVVSAAKLNKVIAANPLPEHAGDGSRFLVSFLSAKPKAADLKQHDLIALDPDNARMGDQVFYQWCPDGVLKAPELAAYAEKHLGVTVTARNWNTILKLDALAAQ